MSQPRRRRRSYSPDEKGAILRRHLSDKVTISSLAEAYVNLGGTFYYLTAVLDGYSRYLLHWELRESMTERDVEIVLQRAREAYPEAKPRVITDNGSAFIARDFKTFLRDAGMTHVRTSPYYPQSNGKAERLNRTIKSDVLRRFQPDNPEKARHALGGFSDHYNNVRLHSAIGYITPADMLADRQDDIWHERDLKLEQARENRKQRRLRQRRQSETEECVAWTLTKSALLQ